MRDLLALAVLKVNPDEIGLPTSTRTLDQGFANIVNLIFILIGGLAILFVIVGGIQMATSAGNPARVKQGRETVIYSVVGIIVSIAAYAVVSYIAGKF